MGWRSFRTLCADDFRRDVALNVLAALMLLSPFCRTATADTLRIQIDGGPGLGGLPIGNQMASTGPLTFSASSTGPAGQTYSGGGTANYGQLTAFANITGGGLVFVESSFDQDVAFVGVSDSVNCPAGNGAVECYGGGAPNDPKAGTPLSGSFFFNVSGSATGELPQYSDATNLAITLNGNDVILSSNGTGTSTSSVVPFVADQVFELNVAFALEIGCTADVCSANYGDPDLTDVLITDPATGLPVLGLGLMGDDGTIYPTDVRIDSPVPEPSSLSVMALALIGLGIIARRRIVGFHIQKSADLE